MALGYLQSALQKLASSQNREPSRQEVELFTQAQQPTQAQLMLQQMMQPQPQQQEMPPEMMAANNVDPYGGVSMQSRKAMHDMGAADPTGELGDMMINRPQAQTPASYKAKTSVRGQQLPAQKEQLVRMLMGRGMNREEAEARAGAF